MKHSQHLKHKKNYTKPLKKKEQLQASQSAKSSSSKLKNVQKKVFGKPSQSNSQKKRNNVLQNIKMPTNADTELDEETVQDILDNVMSDEDDHEVGRGVGKKRKREVTDRDRDDEDRNAKHFEKQYAQMTLTEDRTKKRLVSLLPIKTKAGEVITRTTEVDDIEIDDNQSADEDENVQDIEEEEVDSDDDIVRNETVSSECDFE